MPARFALSVLFRAISFAIAPALEVFAKRLVNYWEKIPFIFKSKFNGKMWNLKIAPIYFLANDYGNEPTYRQRMVDKHLGPKAVGDKAVG